MKRWYCPNCGVFKRTKRTCKGYMGYPEYHCRCCGMGLIDVEAELFLRDAEYIRQVAKREKENE